MKQNLYLENINNAILKVKKFPITVKYKSLHTAKYFELLELCNSLLPINPYLFSCGDTYETRQYKLNVVLNKTKKELDHNLKLCIIKILKDLQGIKEHIELA